MAWRLVQVALALGVTTGCSIDSSGLYAGGVTGIDAGDRRDADTRDTREPPRDSGPPDEDRDGVPASVDCDDADPSVGRMAERACAGECGPGLERCTDGLWLSCDAPTDCTCTDGETRTLACAMCGTQAQVCVGGTWEDDGVCTGAGVCSPGELSSETRSCGRCGTQRRTRTCSASCAWGDFADWGGCTAELACMPGDTETRDVACGVCGTGAITEARTCDGSCAWESWGATTGCADEEYCTDLFGNTVCPGATGGNPSGCMHRHLARDCTCGSDGAWASCGPCRGGW